jgi:hypothetical protein
MDSMKTKLTTPSSPFAFTGTAPALGALPGTRWLARRVAVLMMALILLGGSALPAPHVRSAHFALAVAGHTWNLAGWEIEALSQKAKAAWLKPARAVSDEAGSELVKAYLDRANRMGMIERELALRASQPAQVDAGRPTSDLQVELDDLRQQQDAMRPQVEQVVERQVATVLAEFGFLGIGDLVWPPVSFTFVEPPKKFIVSQRDRIETIYSQMLEAEISLDEIVEAEAVTGQQYNAVGYVTDIGGLGAFPTMVVDRASLRWVLSTVAHEWVHNYLVFHPLGWNYFKSQDLTTMNETVAEIVGNEIGDAVLARFYPDMIPAPIAVSPPASPEPTPFVFQNEMRETRLEVDRLLAEGDVEGAERYMEARRLEFVENGYPLRVLNQAYFAFHGSYGTSPASTSPVGPKLDALRALMPDVAKFLETVRAFNSIDDIDRALSLWDVGPFPNAD